MTFERWKLRLEADCVKNGKMRDFYALGDFVLSLFWESGFDPTVKGISRDLTPPEKTAYGSEATSMSHFKPDTTFSQLDKELNRLLDGEDPLRCPYCIEDGNFRLMVLHVDGRYLCAKCGHVRTP